MTGYQEKVLNLAAKLAALKAEVARLEREFSLLVPQNAQLASAPQLEAVGIFDRVEDSQPSGASLTDRIVGVVTKHPAGIDAITVSGQVGGSINVVRSVLARLTAKGRIQKVGKGLYKGPE